MESSHKNKISFWVIVDRLQHIDLERDHLKNFSNFLGECPLNNPQKETDYVPDHSDIECYTCKKTGHYSKECPEKFAGMSCYNCGKSGHPSSKCSF